MVTSDNQVQEPAEQPVVEETDPAQTPADVTAPETNTDNVVDDQIANEAAEENNETLKEIDKTSGEVVEAIQKVNDAVILVKDQEPNKNPTETDVHIVVERFRYISEGLPLDNSFNECFNIAKEDDLPPMGRFDNVLATIKRWILIAIKYIKEKLAALWKWTKGLFKNSKVLATKIKANNVNNNRKLKKVLVENGEIKNIDVSRDKLIESINVSICPTIKYVGICNTEPKEDLGYLSAYCNSGEFFLNILPKVEAVLAAAIDALRRDSLGTTFESVYQLGDTIDELIQRQIDEYFDSKNKGAQAEFSSKLQAKTYMPIAFNSNKISFIISEYNEIDKTLSFEIKELDITAEANELVFDKISLKDIENQSDITGKTIAEVEARIKTIEDYTSRLDREYDSIIDLLEKLTKSSDDKAVVEDVAKTIKAFNGIVKPIVQVAPYKWVAFTLNYLYATDKFYMDLAENIKNVAASSVKSESDKSFIAMYDKMRPATVNLESKELNPLAAMTDWSNILGKK